MRTETVLKLKLDTLDAWSRKAYGVSAYYGGLILGALATKCQEKADRMRREDRYTGRRAMAFRALEGAALVLRSIHDPRVYALLGKATEKDARSLVADAFFARLA